MGSKASDTNASDPLPSTASYMTSTLLSRRFNINNNSSLGNKKQGNRYNMGTVGRSCVNTIRRSRQNVAIATQVLSPSAIGGSLKGQSVARHFGPPDDDEEGFITYRRHAAWRKLCYYGSAIVAVILILMAIILAVGYLQSEKHQRILSRSVKLVQDRKPSSYIYASTTESSQSLEPTDSHEFFPTAQSSFLLSSDSEDSYSSGEKGSNQNGIFFPQSGESSHKNVIDEDDDYYNHEDENNHVSVHLAGNNNHSEEDKSLDNFLLFVNDHITIEDHGNEPDSVDGNDNNKEDINKGESQEVISNPQSQSVDKLDNDSDSIRVENESVVDVNNNEQWQTIGENVEEEAEEQQQHHPLPSEVKVLPPKDFVFSIEIPIYTPNNTLIAADENNDNATNNTTDTPLEELSEEEFVEKSETNVQSQNNENEQLEILENTNTNNQQDLQGKQLEEDSKEEVSEEFKDSNTYTPKFQEEPYAEDLNENANKFHAVLHTALFNVNDETADEPKRGFLNQDKHVAQNPASAKTEDSDEAAAYSDENVEVSYTETSDSNEHVNDRSRGRNRHIKLLRNDKVMNLKATYAPPNSLKEKYTTETKNVKLEEPLVERKSDAAAQILRLNQIRQGITHLLNKSLGTTTQRSKITNSDDFGNLKDFVLDKSVTQRRPVASSTQEVSLSPLKTKTSESTTELKESGRSLLSSSSSLPDFGIDFKSILEAHKFVPQQEVKGIDQQHARSDFGENFAFNLNQFLPPAAALPTSGPPQDSSQSQLSKRTYNEYDFNIGSPASQTSTSLGLNYFAHLLGQNPAVGTIGNPSAAGATLSSIYAPIFPSSPPANYDISSSATSDTPSLAPGSIPLDLASSFIQVGRPGQYSSGTGQSQGQQQQQQQQAYNPYQPQGASQFGSGSNGIGSLTTLNGQAPQYSSIAQGMHLLNLISGTVPNNYYQDQAFNPNPNFNIPQGSSGFPQDSFKSPSDFSFATSPSFPTVSTLPSFGDTDFLSRFSGSGSQPQSQYTSSAPFQSQYPSPIPTQSQYSSATPTQSQYSSANPTRSYYDKVEHRQVYPSRNQQSSSFRSKEDTSSSPYSEEDDQVPAASSFTQNILTTFQSPVVKKLVSSGIESSTLRNAISLITKPKQKMQSSEIRNSRKTQSEPKSFSFEILPGRSKSPRKDLNSGNSIDDTLNSLNVDVVHSTLDNLVGGSKSRKKGSVSLESSRKTLSKPLSISGDGTTGTTLRLRGGGGGGSSSTNKTKKTTQDSKSTSKPRNQNSNTKLKKPSNNGLKSGFFPV